MAEVKQRHRELAWGLLFPNTALVEFSANDFPIATRISQALADIEAEAIQNRDEEVAKLKSAQMALDQMRDTLATHGLRVVYG